MKRGRLAVAALALVALCLLLLRQERDATGADTRAAPPADEPRAAFEGPDAAREPPSAAEIPPLADAAGGAAAAASRTRSVTGRVVRASDREPMARVKVECSQNFAGLHTLTAEDGSFRLDGLSPDATMLALKAADDASSSCQFPIEGGSDDVLDVQVVMDTGYRIAGIVRDEFSGALRGAEVKLVTDVNRTTTGEDGRFQLADIAGSRGTVTTLQVRAPGHVWQRVDVLAPDDRRTIVQVDIQLSAAGRIEGRILTPTGPAPRGTLVGIAFRLEGHEDSLPYTRTDDSGHYVLDGLATGRYVVRVGEEVGFWMQGSWGRQRRSPTWISDVRVDAGAVTALDVALPAGAEVSGRVLDAQGTPIVGAIVGVKRRLVTADGGVVRADEGGAYTDDSGHYVLVGLPAGSLQLWSTEPERQIGRAQRDFTLRGDERLQDVDFTLTEGALLQGRVTDPDGIPISDVHICLADEGDPEQHVLGETEVGGEFRIAGLAPGAHRLSLRHNLYAWTDVSVDPAGPPRLFVLRPAPSLRLQVLDAATGRAIELFAVRLEYEGQRNWFEAEPRADGAFETQIPCARCDVSVMATGYKQLTLLDVEVAGAGKDPLRFRLAPRP